MQKKTGHKTDQRLERLWQHANAGDLLAIVPCNDTGDLMKVCKRLLDAKIGGWVGNGTSESSAEEFVLTITARDNESRFRSLVRRVQTDLGLSVVVAEGFDVTLSMSVIRDGAAKAIVRQPAGLSSRMEELPSGAMILTFEAAAPKPEFTPLEWREQLQNAYAELRGYERFTFGNVFE